jgi:predicted Rossmann fold nucleotide-binding protein DprA/Smf involved in DNA uptake
VDDQQINEKDARMNCTTNTLRLFAERHGHDIEYWEHEFRRGEDDGWGIVSQSDDDYPYLIDGNGANIEIGYVKKGKNEGQPNKKGAPEFLFYRGDISLLNKENFARNVAVIGLINPTPEIAEREHCIVSELVSRGANIVSGLAFGCDRISHRTCLDNSGKTIAVLPSQINKIVPTDNTALAEEIVDRGGLLVSEYFAPPDSWNKYEAINRFVERDRLQAYFSNSILLIASYRHAKNGGGISYPKDGIKRDSGARHAMKVAKEIGRKRYVLFNEKSDSNNEMFDLNKDILSDSNDAKKAKAISPALIDEMLSHEISQGIQLELPLSG